MLKKLLFIYCFITGCSYCGFMKQKFLFVMLEMCHYKFSFVRINFSSSLMLKYQTNKC